MSEASLSRYCRDNDIPDEGGWRIDRTACITSTGEASVDRGGTRGRGALLRTSLRLGDTTISTCHAQSQPYWSASVLHGSGPALNTGNSRHGITESFPVSRCPHPGSCTLYHPQRRKEMTLSWSSALLLFPVPQGLSSHLIRRQRSCGQAHDEQQADKQRSSRDCHTT